MLLLLDNYDSFTFNLAQYFMELGEEVRVVRNDAIDAAGVTVLAPDAICLSPGPGRPENAGNMPSIIAAYAGKIPMLGVCLGHQAIVQHYGGRIVHAQRLMHGKVSAITHDATGLFAGIPSPFTACRYHSLAAEPESFPACLEVTARAEDGTIMACAHRELPICGAQFHPEAILTEHGHTILKNFLGMGAAV